MGALDASGLWHGDIRSQFESRPVGAFELCHPVTLTRIERNDQAPGRYVFASQEPCEIANVTRSYEEYNSELTVRRLEVKCRPPQNSLGAGDILICTEHPYSSFWAATVPFRTGYKGRIKDLPPLQTRAQLYEAVSAARNDWWESTGRLTAAVEEDLFHRVFLHRRHDLWRGRTCVLGVLPVAGDKHWQQHLDDVEMELYRCAPLRKLVSQAKAGRLLVGRRATYARGDAIQEAETLLWFSVKQALAGPRHEFEGWSGRPVIELVDRIFRANMHVLSQPSAALLDRQLDLEAPEMTLRNLQQAAAYLAEFRAIGRDEEET